MLVSVRLALTLPPALPEAAVAVSQTSIAP
jgi:hypothetical protein